MDCYIFIENRPGSRITTNLLTFDIFYFRCCFRNLITMDVWCIKANEVLTITKFKVFPFLRVWCSGMLYLRFLSKPLIFEWRLNVYCNISSVFLKNVRKFIGIKLPNKCNISISLIKVAKTLKESIFKLSVVNIAVRVYYSAISI